MQNTMPEFVTRTYALDDGPKEDIAQQLRDRAEITDALYRFGLGQDLRNRDLFASAFTEDAILDFRPAAIKCGLEVPLMTGRQAITDIILNPDTKPDTSHVVSNCRIVIDGDIARVTALVEAQHVAVSSHKRYALLKNIYDVRLQRSDSSWQMNYVYIDNIWYMGEPEVITGA